MKIREIEIDEELTVLLVLVDADSPAQCDVCMGTLHGRAAIDVKLDEASSIVDSTLCLPCFDGGLVDGAIVVLSATASGG